MLVLGFAWLVLWVADLIWRLNPLLQVISNVIWIIFTVDFAVTFTLAPHKLVYLTHNWLTVIFLALPALRVFRIVRVSIALENPLRWQFYRGRELTLISGKSSFRKREFSCSWPWAWMVKSTRRSLGDTDNKDDEFDASSDVRALPPALLRDLRSSVLGQGIKPESTRNQAYIARPQNNHPQANQLYTANSRFMKYSSSSL